MRIQANGITLGYNDLGKGLPLVFLHAFPLNRTMWASQEEALASRFRVITVDLRGHGESDAPAWRYSLDQYALDVKEVLLQLGVTKAVFVGLSMGGYLEFALFRHYPALIRALVFADTKAEADKPEQARWRFDLAQQTVAGGLSVVIDEMLPKLLSPKTYAQQPALVEWVRGVIASAPIAGVVGDLMALAERPDSSGLLPSIDVPTLVLVGQDDGLTTPADAGRIASGISHARLVTIPDAGHLSNMEQPDLFNRAVEEFLEELAESPI